MNLEDIDFNELADLIISKWSIIDEENNGMYQYVKMTTLALSKMFNKNPNQIDDHFSNQCSMVMAEMGLYPDLNYINGIDSSSTDNHMMTDRFENASSNGKINPMSESYQQMVKDAYDNGEKIQVRSKTADHKFGRSWHNMSYEPVWNWDYYEYRIAGEDNVWS